MPAYHKLNFYSSCKENGLLSLVFCSCLCRTEADPNILAKYVWALLRNNKPKKELEEFCAEKLVDFLGEGM